MALRPPCYCMTLRIPSKRFKSFFDSDAADFGKYKMLSNTGGLQRSPRPEDVMQVVPLALPQQSREAEGCRRRGGMGTKLIILCVASMTTSTAQE